MKKVILTGLFMLMSMTFLCPFVIAQDIVVIANQGASESSVDSEWVKNAYLGNITKWSNNDPIVLSVMKDDDLHSSFLEKYVQRSSSQFNALWKNMMFTGKGKMPKTLKSEDEMIDYVANTRGAIGYIISDSRLEKVNIINSD